MQVLTLKCSKRIPRETFGKVWYKEREQFKILLVQWYLG